MAGDDQSKAEKTEPMIGSYRLVRPLGSGGMSSVYYAVHAETTVEVAVKVLPRNLARNRTVLQRFLREAKSAEALQHPNIVAIYDRGVDDGRYYLVLEYIAGGDLHDWVRSNGPMSIPDAMAVIRSVSEGLKFAAGQGLIHRDIKPANLLMTPARTVKIADLGLALHADAEDERVTREGTTVGTVDYMAPEQARDSRATSERSDIYSLGCTFFYLLTGQAPYAGGDVTEKLTKHFTAPVPDPRDFRPDVPTEISAILRKMMAKHTERRFATYDELIAALDAVPLLGPSGSSGPEAFDAVIVDDDDDEGAPSPPWPLETEVGRNPADLGPVYAIVDDDDGDESADSDGFLPILPTGPAHRANDAEEPRVIDVSMADLAAMIDNDEDEDVPAPRSTPKRPAPAPAPLVPEKSKSGLFEEEDDEAMQGKMPGQVAFSTGQKLTAAEKSWLTGLVLSALGLIVAVIAFHQLYLATLTQPPSDPSVTASDEPPISPPEPVAPALPTPRPPPNPKKIEVKAAAHLPESIKPQIPAPPTQPSVWTEPLDPSPAYVSDAQYPSELEIRFRPDWATTETNARTPGKTVVVRRLSNVRDSEQKPSLSSALEEKGGTVEISDNGPFFEDTLRFTGETRVVRARPGFRPVICLIRPKLTVVQQQATLLDIDSRSLVLEGVDLIVDVKDLPRRFASMFLCRGGSLTLRDCTVTVVNQGKLPFSVVQTGLSEKTSRVHLERTFVRGNFTSVVDLLAGPADVFLSRSVVVNKDGALFSASGAGNSERRVFVGRSLAATSGPAIDLAAFPPGVRPRALTLRSLGSTFTHLATPKKISLIEWRGEGAGAVDLVDWRGDFNEFKGWPDWLSVGTGHSVRVPSLSAARAIWAGTDPKSQEFPAAQTLVGSAERTALSALGTLCRGRLDVFARVAEPTPWIIEKTLEPFPSVVVPGFSTATGAEPAGLRELAFDAEGPTWSGDLGRFLAQTIKPEDSLVKVKVTGTGEHKWSPLRLPDGVSLEIVVLPDPSGRTPSWSPLLTKAETLIELRRGSLVLNGVNLTSDRAADLKRLIVVEGGHLVIHRSRLTARGASEAGGAGLIGFNATGSRPLTPGNQCWPFETPVDKPTCRVTESVLISGGEVISAEVGRGLVAFSQCGVAAGSTAFSLLPGLVARNRLEADLWLDHCTVVSERSFVMLGPWLGTEPGPDRPWLVSTRSCAFFSSYQRPPGRESVLLRVDPDAFSHGAVFWQAAGDAFEVSLFAMPGDSKPPPGRRPDVVRQWGDLWGPAHMVSVTGPRLPNGLMSRRLLTRPKPGEVQPGDLVIDPGFPPDDPPKDLGADNTKLGISAPPARPPVRP